MKVYKTIPCFFLMAALCGCTTQSIEDAKAIEETKSYAYRYEYETDSAGEAVTKIYNEKPTYDENEQVEEYQQGALSNKTSMMKFIKMNETFEYYDCEFTVKEAVATRNYNYAKEIIDDKYIDEKGAFDISKCDLVAYANGGYYALGKKVGKFGFSVQKKKKSK